jgi:CDP-diacylglycerol--serine O-phosphatidyltransferase
MADIVSFGTAPAVFVFAVVAEAWTPLTAHLGPYALAVVVPGLFAVLAIVRAAFYTVHFGEETTRPGVQNTLGASILAAGYLAIGGTLGLQTTAWVVLAGATVLGLSMIAPVPYPKLVARDALAMGVVQMGAILLPGVGGRVFPRVLLVAALVYLVLAPRYYWA